ncbi:hypothetical protein PISMIDRAFT_497278 [Pisolithus microcarpus 441]|uniref:Uncharacterized protein n=1 Tax=Pisolithus microcarpus 441 TaxID=765257 RepID=A0A0C9YUI9_9AGAM|nr:hypothetical protein PISMIDRAFT_495199 [Pisolithus microcarpus 441]KIK22509.1 hypothetical protein PISMIDRAFT_497278 [Pisolithus microcarpus 441]
MICVLDDVYVHRRYTLAHFIVSLASAYASVAHASNSRPVLSFEWNRCGILTNVRISAV